MNHWTTALVALLFVGFGACTKAVEEPDEEIKALDERIGQMETELSVFRERIKTADTDRGLRDQLVEDEALLKSRLERLKERAKEKRPDPTGH